MSSPPATEEPAKGFDYIGEDDDDEDDEDDFVPGVEEEDDDDDASSTVVPLLDGILYYGAQHALHYQGEGFHLASSEAAPWDILDSKVKPKADQCEFIMTGPCDFETAGAKATPRKLKVTFTVSEPPTNANATSTNGNHLDSPISRSSTQGKSTESPSIQGGDDDGKHDSKAGGVYYKVFGSQIESNGGDLMEFLGGYYPSSTKDKKVGLLCQARMIPASSVSAKPAAAMGGASAAAASPAVAAAAAAAPSSAAARIDDEDDDDEYEEADEDVDYNELIALHQDAGMSVDEIKKRYREEDGTGDSSVRENSNKKRKPPPPSQEEDDDDFDGF